MKEKTDKTKIKIGVVGAGSWGTALADLLDSKGFTVDFWVYEAHVKKQIAEYGENKMYLPGFSLSPNLCPSNNLVKVVSDKD
ncbi:MAG: glycerol-3-phosphate dehydrogenase, partial [Desulfobacterales bacterium]|nr:glycerol-3-phosphate dehydrogenase [Desulfobacterales bacterium]